MLRQRIHHLVRARFTSAMFPRAQCRSIAATFDVNCENEENSEYEDAIKTLNLLQSNAASIRLTAMSKKNSSLDDTLKYVRRSGITVEDLDKLPVIHVSGTKGKGSTCALTESILRAYGVRTGFFSSPHLVSVTERFRINGKAITEQKFVQTFWKVFDKLEKHKESEKDMPGYFRFLTILCFHIFLDEKVDVAVLEVGIGGQYDCTNVIRNTSTVGVASLGFDHTNILGNTIEEIATQKAGIIKPNSTVFTNVTQPECIQVLEKMAKEKNAKFFKAPELSEYKWPQHAAKIKFNKMVQLNGSLAIQLAYNWLNRCYLRKPKPDKVTLNITKQVLDGLQNCVWPGRCQCMEYHNFRIHLDGAHTLESMGVCMDWFEQNTRENSFPKVLIFNATGERDSKALLRALHDRVRFDYACFVPNVPLKSKAAISLYSNQDQTKRPESHHQYWSTLPGRGNNPSNCKVYDTIMDAFLSLKNQYCREKVDVLVTGSIHLLGATILALNEFDKRVQHN